MFYPIAWLLGAMMIHLGRKIDPQMVRVDLQKVRKFLVWMLGVSVFRLVVFGLLGSASAAATFKNFTAHGSLAVLPMVWWEDAVFTLPVLIMEKLQKPRWLTRGWLVIAMLSFGLGHVYQGPLGFFMAAMYLPRVSYFFGKKNGLGTVMTCHVVYDAATLLTVFLVARFF